MVKVLSSAEQRNVLLAFSVAAGRAGLLHPAAPGTILIAIYLPVILIFSVLDFIAPLEQYQTRRQGRREKSDSDDRRGKAHRDRLPGLPASVVLEVADAVRNIPDEILGVQDDVLHVPNLIWNIQNVVLNVPDGDWNVPSLVADIRIQILDKENSIFSGGNIIAYKRRASQVIADAQERATNLKAIDDPALDLGGGLTVAVLEGEIAAAQTALEK